MYSCQSSARNSQQPGCSFEMGILATIGSCSSNKQWQHNISHNGRPLAPGAGRHQSPLLLKVRAKPKTACCVCRCPPHTSQVNVRTTDLHLISALTTRDDTDCGLPGIRSIDSSDFVVLARAYLPHYYKCVLNQTAC